MAATGVGVKIRPMRPGDIPQVADLEAAVFSQPWSAGLFRDELARPNRIYVVGEGGDGSIAGYGGVMLIGEDGHVITMAVHPDRRGRHLGARLLLALVDESLRAGLRHLTLEVRRSNLVAQGLYERFGFSAVGVRKNYYPDEDALVMWAIDIDGEGYAERLDEIRRSLR